MTEPTNEFAFTVLEHAMKHVENATNADNGNDQFDTAHMLIEAWQAIGPCGQIPSWLEHNPDNHGQVEEIVSVVNQRNV